MFEASYPSTWIACFSPTILAVLVSWWLDTTFWPIFLACWLQQIITTTIVISQYHRENMK